MALRGRKPNSANVNRVRGNPGKRAPKKREPKPVGALPAAPAYLDAGGKAEWKHQAKAMAATGLLTGADHGVLAAYCASYSRWCEAQKHLNKATVVKAGNGTEIPSPWLAVSNKAQDQFVKLAGELGLTPTARTRLTGSTSLPAPARETSSGWNALD
jgi:P27 family predicted phage terminase small subunit